MVVLSVNTPTCLRGLILCACAKRSAGVDAVYDVFIIGLPSSSILYSLAIANEVIPVSDIL